MKPSTPMSLTEDVELSGYENSLSSKLSGSFQDNTNTKITKLIQNNTEKKTRSLMNWKDFIKTLFFNASKVPVFSSLTK
jgi:hypothetical protein